MYIFCYILGFIVVLTAQDRLYRSASVNGGGRSRNKKGNSHRLSRSYRQDAISVEAGDYCSYRYKCYDIFGSYSYCYKYTYCDMDVADPHTVILAKFVVPGAVIGGLIVLGVVIALIVYCCVYAHNSGKHSGVVVLPMNTTQIRTVTATNAAIAPGPSSYPGHYGPVICVPLGDQKVPPPYTPFNTGTSGTSISTATTI